MKFLILAIIIIFYIIANINFMKDTTNNIQQTEKTNYRKKLKII
jgi:hypothetical protein